MEVHAAPGSARHARFAHPERNVAVLGVEPGMRVADFGAGSGAYALALLEAVTHAGAVYAVDVQKDLLRRIANNAKAHGYKNVHVIAGDLEAARSTKLADKLLDVVLMSNILFQLENKQAAFVEARRILKPSGRLVVIDWSDSYGGMGPHKKAVVTKEAALRLAESSGFSGVREFTAGEHHYGLIFKKTL